MSRPKKDSQRCLSFLPPSLALTSEFYARYEAISETLDACPQILNRVHRDLEDTLGAVNATEVRRRGFRYTVENVLRILLVQIIEGLSLRAVVVRIDDSKYFPSFTRLGNRPMMSFTHLDCLKNAIQPETWKAMNFELARYAVREELISGEHLRLDTTAIETNIHYPTDSSLLWDSYRVLARLITDLRTCDPDAVGTGRIRLRDVKRHYSRISRKAAKKGQSAETLKPLYVALIEDVERICAWTESILGELQTTREKDARSDGVTARVDALGEELCHFMGMAQHILWQTKRRVFENSPVSGDEKLFSIFEDHTEMLIRGKAGKKVEFGHMIGIQQVREKFITDFEVCPHKPIDYELIPPALASHRKLFGSDPDAITADKSYWKGKDELKKLSKRIPLVAICKKGKRTEEEEEREHATDFADLQRFRAGVEGTISFLKRCFRLVRCMNKGWSQFAATIGAAIFSHNLVTLVRPPC